MDEALQYANQSHQSLLKSLKIQSFSQLKTIMNKPMGLRIAHKQKDKCQTQRWYDNECHTEYKHFTILVCNQLHLNFAYL